MNFKFLLPLLLVMCVSLVPTRGQAQEHALAITNVTIIDGTGAAPRPGMTVLLVGDRIRTIRRKLRIPAGAEVVDATGKYLIPGLRDMHVHVGSYEDGKVLFRRLVAFGITGVRDMASPPDDIIRLREGIREGTLFGPRITLAGPILQGPLPFQPPPMVRIVVNSEDARRAVDELSRKGVDFIKVGDTLDRDEYLAVAAQARKKGLPFAGHLPVSVGAAEASHAGQRSIEHFGSVRFHGLLIACSDDEVALHRTAQHALDTARMGGPSPDATLMRATFINSLLNGYNAGKARRLFAEFPKNRTWQVPTLVAIKDVWNRQRAELTPADSAAADRLWHKYSEVIRSMRAAGVRLMAGTDVPIGDMVSPLHDELGLLVEAGLSPMEALQTATRNPAEYLGLLRNEGTVTAGKVADLVLLDADPLTDITNIRRINSVVLRGRLIRNTELQQLR
jgi:imidazolonepropionase-like amidohydrolase